MKRVRKYKYLDSILIYMKMKTGFYKIYALQRHMGTNLAGETLWKYYLLNVPKQPHHGYETIEQIYEHIDKLFVGQKSIFEQWAKMYPKEGRITSLGSLVAARIYTW